MAPAGKRGVESRVSDGWHSASALLCGWLVPRAGDVGSLPLCANFCHTLGAGRRNERLRRFADPRIEAPRRRAGAPGDPPWQPEPRHDMAPSAPAEQPSGVRHKQPAAPPERQPQQDARRHTIVGRGMSKGAAVDADSRRSAAHACCLDGWLDVVVHAERLVGSMCRQSSVSDVKGHPVVADGHAVSNAPDLF